MRCQLLVSRFLGQTLTARIEDGRLVTLRVDRDGDMLVTGAILLGRVVRIVPGLNAAFVEVGQQKAAFLSADDAGPNSFGTLGEHAAGAPRPSSKPIHTLVQVGQKLLVQVRRPPSGTKGARVTSRIHIGGRLVVLMPQAQHVAISSRIDEPEARARLLTLLAPLAPRFGGMVARTAAAQAPEAALTAELQQLSADWQALVHKAQGDGRPRLLHQPHDEVPPSVAGLWGEDVERIDCDDDALAARLQSWLAQRAPARAHAVYTFAPLPLSIDHGGPLELFESKKLAQQRSDALKTTVPLSNGGALHLELTEALCVIDVDSNKFVGRAAHGPSMLALNLEAAREVARQLRLRNIGGIIVIDFVDLAETAAQVQLVEHLKAALEADPAPSVVLPMSAFGIVQLTRRRAGPSVHEALEAPCTHCHGRGRQPSALEVVRALLVAVRRSQRRMPARRMLLNVAPDIAALLWGEAHVYLTALERELSVELVPVTQDGWANARFEVLNSAWPERVDAYVL